MSEYKYGLILDTNVFIYLSQQNRYPAYVYDTFLNNMIFNPHILFIIPEQIQIEWNRIIKEKEESFIIQEKKPLIDALKLCKYMDTEKEKENYIESIKQALQIKDRIHKYVFKKRIKMISNILFGGQDILSRPRVTLVRSSSVENLVVNLSLNHSAPFFGDDNGKGKINEMADAIIYYSACEFAKENPDLCESYFFITDETNFSKGPELHEKIKKYADDANLGYYCGFKTFIDNELNDTPEEYQKKKNPDLFLSDKYFVLCGKCKKEIHVNVDGNWERSDGGEYWHYQCECGHVWHEYEDRD